MELTNTKLAVIDIGSNAIRTVVYESGLLGAPAVFHSKFKCDIKGLLDKDEEDNTHQIYTIFQYFAHYFEKNNVKKVKCVATEVLRKHKKANEFIALIKEKYNLDIEILTGEQEAKLAGIGLISGIKNISGLGVDFGGGSLELIKISNENVEKTISIPFGTNLNNDSIPIEKVFESISNNFKEENFTNLYLIGGTFRLIGRNYMYTMNHQMRILHNINISIDKFYEYVSNIENDKNLYLKNSQQDAIKIIKSIVDITGAKNIIISSYGLKEGVRFQYLLDNGENKKDIIYEKSKFVTNFDEESCNIEAYFKVLQNLNIFHQNLLKETLSFSIMFARFYFRSGNNIGGTFVYDFVMTSDIPFTEKQRILLVASLSLIFFNNIPYNIKKLCKGYLSDSEYSIANIIGNFIMIAVEIDGAVMYNPKFRLTSNGKFIEVETDYVLPSIIYHRVKKNLKEISFFIRKTCDKD